MGREGRRHGACTLVFWQAGAALVTGRRGGRKGARCGGSRPSLCRPHVPDLSSELTLPACKAAATVPPWEIWGAEASGQRGPFQGRLGGQPAGFMCDAASECGHPAPREEREPANEVGRWPNTLGSPRPRPVPCTGCTGPGRMRPPLAGQRRPRPRRAGGGRCRQARLRPDKRPVAGLLMVRGSPEPAPRGESGPSLATAGEAEADQLSRSRGLAFPPVSCAEDTARVRSTSRRHRDFLSGHRSPSCACRTCPSSGHAAATGPVSRELTRSPQQRRVLAPSVA